MYDVDPKAIAHDLIIDLYGQVRAYAMENDGLRKELERVNALLSEDSPADEI